MILICLLLLREFLPTSSISCYEGCFCHFETMNCSNQSLADIPDFPESVTNLKLPYNLIYQIRNLEPFAKLNKLDLSHNRLKSLQIHLNNNATLHTLKLADNPLNHVQINSSTLKTLDLSWCDLARLQAGFLETLPSLEVLDISHNPLKLMYPLRGNLKELHLRGCLIHDISFFDLPELKLLDISFNRYMKVLKFESNLTALKAAHGSLYQADLALPKLRLLDLSYNKMSQVLIDSPNLLDLDLSWNSLRRLELNFVDAALELIDLSHNLLHEVELHLNRLSFLNVSFNPLTSLKISSASLKLVDCFSCQLKYIDLPVVHTLNLSRNNMETFEGEATVLDLSHNLLTKYKGNAKIVDLRGNRLSLPKNVQLNGVASLDNNPWLCNCDDPALKELYMKAIDQVTCTSPEGKTWESCYAAKLPKYIAEYPWVPLVATAVLTLLVAFCFIVMKRKIWPNQPAESHSSHSHSEFVVVPQNNDQLLRERVENQLPSYEEALLMNKPRYSNRRSYEFVSNRRLSSSSI